MKTVSQLTSQQLTQTANTLAFFFDFTSFRGREFDDTLALTYALEFQACNLGLLYPDDSNEHCDKVLMDFVTALVANADQLHGVNAAIWSQLAPSLPFIQR